MSDRPSIVLPPAGSYPERGEDGGEGSLDRGGQALWLYGGRRLRAGRNRQRRLLALYRGQRAAFDGLDLAGLGEAARDFRREIRRAGIGEATAARAFALVGRTLCLTGMGEADDTDIAAAWVMLAEAVAETPPAAAPQRAVALVACTAALAGQPVHVIGPDDDWAARAGAALAPVGAALGIGCGVLRRDDPPAQRQAACERAIVVAGARELAFEYLRDRLRIGDDRSPLRLLLRRLDKTGAPGGPTLRGLAFGIVAEADAVLLDGANAPIAIAGHAGEAPAEAIAAALGLAAALAEGSDFACDRSADVVEFTEQGRQRLATLTAGMAGVWQGAAARERMVQLALRARLVHTAERHYRIESGHLVILDPESGGVRPERSLPAALQQMIEVKEGLPPSPQGGTLARLAMQRFFRRYVHLCGISATAREAAHELAAIYRLPVLRIGPREPAAGMRALATAAEKWATVVGRVAALQGGARPLLVGVGSAADADALGLALDVASIAWRRAESPADFDAPEAGAPVAIALPDAWRPAWGTMPGRFHVILADGQPGGRLDRQLARRAGGEGGCFEAVVSLEDSVAQALASAMPAALRTILLRFSGDAGLVRRWLYRLAQRRAAREPMRLRRRLLQYDMQLGSMLAFAGRGE